MRRIASTVVVGLVVLFVDTAAAFGAEKAGPTPPADPTKIGENVKDVFAPNAKAFWWVLLVSGLLFMAASRKAGRAVATGVLLVVSGVAIYNPGGVGAMMAGLADKIV